MAQKSTFLVLGATGGTGKHFVAQALANGHKVRALVRTPEKLEQLKLPTGDGNLEVVRGSITDPVNIDDLVKGVDYVVSMLGDKVLQSKEKINAAFVKKLVPSMRQHGVKRFLYQAGGLSRPYQGSLTPMLWTIRYTVGRSFEGQHQDNEAVIEYLTTEANDIEWIVHRAGIYGDGPSKGTLQRSPTKFSIGNHRDCADYSYRTITDASAVRTCHFSHYVTG